MNGQAEPFESGLVSKDEIYGCREDVARFLVKGGIEGGVAFNLVEKLRKGKTLTGEEEKQIKDCDLKSIVKQNILKIKYLFPEAHATSYSDDAMRIMWYKVYKPEAFYPVVLTQYASDVSDFDYTEVSACNTKEELKRLHKSYSRGQNQKVIIKFKTRLANLIYEAKLRGFTLKPANLYSHHNLFTIDPADPKGKTIVMPLSSIGGVAEKTAEKIYHSLKESKFTTFEEMLERKDDNNRKIFSKKALEGLGLYDMDERQIKKFEKSMSIEQPLTKAQEMKAKWGW